MRGKSSAAYPEIHPQLTRSRLDPRGQNPGLGIGNPELGVGNPVGWMVGNPLGVGYPDLGLTLARGSAQPQAHAAHQLVGPLCRQVPDDGAPSCAQWRVGHPLPPCSHSAPL